ncbi:MAG: rhodanese-like domain-containing protein [Bacteroidales bacterium]|nr:rhodanese-like domain-containing protein [Bacteroidales bacterium]
MDRRKGMFIALFLICSSLHAQDSLQKIQRLSPEDFYIKLHQSISPVLIDVRTPKEYRKYRIPGAHLAENRAALISFTDTLDRYQPLFLYCEFENRSIQAAEILKKAGFQRILILEDGLSGWIARGYEIDRKRIKPKFRNRKSKTDKVPGRHRFRVSSAEQRISPVQTTVCE